MNMMYRLGTTPKCFSIFVGWAWELNIFAGKGVPNELEKRQCGTTPLPPNTLPSTHMARDMYLEQGGDLTAFSYCGNDPLRNRQDLVERRDRLFYDRNPSYQEIYSNVSSSDGQQLKCAILSFIGITESLQQLL